MRDQPVSRIARRCQGSCRPWLTRSRRRCRETSGRRAGEWSGSVNPALIKVALPVPAARRCGAHGDGAVTNATDRPTINRYKPVCWLRIASRPSAGRYFTDGTNDNAATHRRPATAHVPQA